MNDDEARAVLRLAGPVTTSGPEPDLDRIIARGRRTRTTRTAAVVASSAAATAAVVLIVVSAGAHGPAPQFVVPASPPSGDIRPATPTPSLSPTGATTVTTWSPPPTAAMTPEFSPTGH